MEQVTIDDAGQCLIRASNGRMFYSTPAQVGLALLSQYLGADDDEESRARSISWADFLPTHGVAMGVRRNLQIHLAVLPAAQRTVLAEAGGILHQTTVTFPPTLIGVTLRDGQHVRAILMLADMTRQAQFGVVSTTPVLVPFPYGNVYHESGYICWGSVPHNNIHSIKELETLFFGSGFNTDLAAPAVSGIRQLPPGGGVLPPPATELYTHTFTQAISRLLRD